MRLQNCKQTNKTISMIPATQEAEAGGSEFEASPCKISKTLSQKKGKAGRVLECPEFNPRLFPNTHTHTHKINVNFNSLVLRHK
jgi:hypothetical protein